MLPNAKLGIAVERNIIIVVLDVLLGLLSSRHSVLPPNSNLSKEEDSLTRTGHEQIT